ncbi:DNA cytosine methyltransferase [Cryomorpha ignava]|uniref:DNA (cytosine-5-)-methyltransferase n=1 Tax=Cryomorpha ignava TaxID=101383 RepID=A0A7K3WUM7_9FLAO|nr:DNA cytosine methyltransferase [Cryomorpha ignava]NEN25367.1 DNA cytosine methyltransferase [Cryomorpha ignava]
MIGVELFAGVGGMSLGATMAGIDVRLAVEIDKHAATTFSLNHPATRMLNIDICDLKEIELVKNGQQTVLFGGPPCQGFSTSNQRNRNKENPNNWLYLEFIRLLKSWAPDWVVLENVKGLKETEGGTFLDLILIDIEQAGYTVSYKVLNAADFGVPQKRERIFVVGSRHGKKFDFPDKLAANKVSVKDAISDLPKISNGNAICALPYRRIGKSEFVKLLRNGSDRVSNNLVTKNSELVVKRYSHIPQGGNWENIPNELMGTYKDASRCHTGIYRRLEEDKPSVVIGNYRKNMLVHPKENRGLSVREAARLQSFPDWFKFKGSIGFQQQQVGNAVPPLLAKAVFKHIIDAR